MVYLKKKNPENTDNLVLNVTNNLILNENNDKITTKVISRSHRVGKLDPSRRKTRDIIVKFISYRERARVYANKKNLIIG